MIITIYLPPVFASVLFVGESFSSAIRGKNSPGPERVSDNLLELSEFLFSELVAALLLDARSPSAEEFAEVSSLSSLTGSVAGAGRHTVLELPLLAAFTTGGLPEDAQHKGEISAHLLSALRGCNLSGDKALRNSGEPGSEPLGRTNPFFVCPETAVVGVLPALGE